MKQYEKDDFKIKYKQHPNLYYIQNKEDDDIFLFNDGEIYNWHKRPGCTSPYFRTKEDAINQLNKYFDDFITLEEFQI